MKKTHHMKGPTRTAAFCTAVRRPTQERIDPTMARSTRTSLSKARIGVAHHTGHLDRERFGYADLGRMPHQVKARKAKREQRKSHEPTFTIQVQGPAYRTFYV